MYGGVPPVMVVPRLDGGTTAKPLTVYTAPTPPNNQLPVLSESELKQVFL